METALYCKSPTVSAASQSRKPDPTSPNDSNSIGSIYSQDNFPLYITTPFTFDGKNYFEWSQSVRLEITGRGKLKYLTGELSAPEKDDPKYPIWKAENAMVMVWLINSMEPEIGRIYLFSKTAKEIWDKAKKMYSDVGNVFKIFEIHRKLKELWQGNKNVTDYFSDLQYLWRRLDYLNHEDEPLCAECSIKHKHRVEEDRVFEFLIGLNNSFNEIRGRLVSRTPFPTITEAFSEVRREEARRRVRKY